MYISLPVGHFTTTVLEAANNIILIAAGSG